MLGRQRLQPAAYSALRIQDGVMAMHVLLWCRTACQSAPMRICQLLLTRNTSHQCSIVSAIPADGALPFQQNAKTRSVLSSSSTGCVLMKHRFLLTGASKMLTTKWLTANVLCLMKSRTKRTPTLTIQRRQASAAGFIHSRKQEAQLLMQTETLSPLQHAT